MLRMRDHGVEDYAGLPDMDATDVGVLGADDRACLEELGRYLVDTDAWQRFGIWLLHKHFEPGPGEVFVEQALTASRQTQTTPMARSGVDQLNMTAFRFDAPASASGSASASASAGGGVGVIGMEFAGAGDFGDIAPLGDDDEAVLAGLAERLAARGKTGRFGVRLIRNPLGLSERELLHETCDSTTRTLHCDVGERDAVLADDTVVQTAWRWKLVHGENAPIVMQDCTATCVRAGEGNDIGHSLSEPDDFGND